MIKIVSEAAYGLHYKNRIVVMTKKSGPFALSEPEEAALVRKGIAEYVGEKQQPEQITLEYLKSLKMDELKEFAEQHGIKYVANARKAEFAEIVWDKMRPDDVPFGGLL